MSNRKLNLNTPAPGWFISKDLASLKMLDNFIKTLKAARIPVCCFLKWNANKPHVINYYLPHCHLTRPSNNFNRWLPLLQFWFGVLFFFKALGCKEIHFGTEPRSKQLHFIWIFYSVGFFSFFLFNYPGDPDEILRFFSSLQQNQLTSQNDSVLCSHYFTWHRAYKMIHDKIVQACYDQVWPQNIWSVPVWDRQTSEGGFTSVIKCIILLYIYYILL